MSLPMGWQLRPVTTADDDLLLRVFACTRAEELALIGWDPTQREAFVRQQALAQARHYQAHWPDAEHWVVVQVRQGAARDVGRLWLHRRAGALHVLDIALLPDWRGQGLGTQLLRQLMADAAGRGCALTIYVEAGNPARRLYDRLGFQAVGNPDGIHQFMRWCSVVAPTPSETSDAQA